MAREHYYAISGKIGSGKTSIANGLIALFSFQRRGFADAIKEAVATALACPVEDVYTQKQTFRSSLQALGQAARAYWGEDYWVRKTLEFIEEYEDEIETPHYGVHFVLDDLRFPNEATALRDFGFKLVRIDDDPWAHRDFCRKQGYTKEQQSHISETALDLWTEWDIVVSGRPHLMNDVFADFLTATGLAEDINWGRHYAAKALGHGD